MSDFFTESKTVIELKPGDFEEKFPSKLKSKECTAILFYCYWCHHCVKLKGEWEKLGTIIGFCNVAAFHCAAYQEHTDKIKEETPGLIEGYPSIVFYKKGSPVETYKGERKASLMSKMCMRNCS